jgi:hypothetical protein
MEEAAEAKIRDLQILFLAKEGIDPEEKIKAIKKVLSEGYPVLVSHTLLKSFQPSEKVWRIQEGESMADEHGAHAMVIVGYDDEQYGGAFRYLNSWGSDWGDGGFIWVPYATTGALCYGAYQAFPFPKQPVPAPAPAPVDKPIRPNPAVPTPPSPAPAPVAENLPGGGMQFVTAEGENMAVNRISSRGLIVEDASVGSNEFSAYRMAAPYPSGTRFRFYLETTTEGYVYAFATDLSREVTQIFPYDNQVSPLIGSQSVVAFPADDKVIRMDNKPGTDYLLVLFSQQKLDIDKLLSRMEVTAGGLTGKIQSALGPALIDPAAIKFEAGKVGFTVRPGARGTVVPVMVEISHL